MSICAQRAIVLQLVVYCAVVVAAPLPASSQEAESIPSDRAAAIAHALSEKTDIDATDLPLAQLIERIKKRHGIEIQLDDKALADAGIDAATKITRHMNDVTLRSALHLTLDELDLTFVIRHEVLMITTKTEAENIVEARVYPVGDLVRADPDFVAESRPRIRAEFDPGRRNRDDYGMLIEVITSTVKPDCWDDVGGPGPIRSFNHAQAIVVPQTQEIHQEIAQLLAALRAVRERQRAPARAARRGPVDRPAEADHTLRLRVYPRFYSGNTLGGMGGGFFQMGSADLAGPATTSGAPDHAEVQARLEELAKLVREFVAVDSWDAPGGKGKIRAAAGRLVVLQTEDIHREIEEFIESFSGARLHGSRRNMTHWEPGVDWPHECEPRPGAAEAAIERKLGQRVALSLDDVPLDELVSRLKRDYAVESQLDGKALADAATRASVCTSRMCRSNRHSDCFSIGSSWSASYATRSCSSQRKPKPKTLS